MLKINSFAIIGGDLRQKYLANRLMELGYSVNTYNYLYDGATEYSNVSACVKDSDALILPLPVSSDDKTVYSNEINKTVALSEILTPELSGRIVFGGKANESILKFMQEHNVLYYDYFNMESMTVKNALATAEGAVAIAVQNTKFTLYDSEILVAGYGRIGKALTKILLSFGARVTVAARNASQRDWARFDGANVVDCSSLRNKNAYDLVFNTVPHIIFTKSELEEMKSDVIIIDLASFPGGVDLHWAKSCGIKVITATALPSRFSPQSAGCFIADEIITMIKEEV